VAGVRAIIETTHVRERWRQGFLKRQYWVDRAVSHFVDYYVAVSYSNARYLTEEKGLQPSKVVTIRNGCDLAKFDSTSRRPWRTKAKIHIDADDPVVTCVGRLEPQKGHSVLFEALPTVLAEFPRLRIICLGDGSLRPALEQRCRELNLLKSVHFLGMVSNVSEWLAVSDFTVLPSFYEGLPLAAIESLAAGTPVIATEVDGTPEVVVNGVTGLTVHPGDPTGLANAMLLMMRHAGMRHDLGARGRRLVEQEFNVTRQIAETERLYRFAVFGHPMEQREPEAHELQQSNIDKLRTRSHCS
jgi:glycosyltransferase involved in cell wall biosynthesis